MQILPFVQLRYRLIIFKLQSPGDSIWNNSFRVKPAILADNSNENNQKLQSDEYFFGDVDKQQPLWCIQWVVFLNSGLSTDWRR